MIFYKIYFLKLRNKKICTIVSGTNLPAVSVLCFIATKISILICLILLYNWTFFQKISIKDTAQSQTWGPQTAYRTVSIEQPGLEFLQKSLLNVPYNQKNEGLIVLSLLNDLIVVSGHKKPILAIFLQDFLVNWLYVVVSNPYFLTLTTLEWLSSLK